MILPTRNKRAQAEAALAKGQPEKAAKLLEKWLASEPGDLKVRRQLGDLYRQLGQTEQAIVHYTALAGAHAAAGLLLRAISTCKLILELDPAHTETQRVLASLYANKGDGVAAQSTEGAAVSTPSLPPMMASALMPPVPPPEDDELELDDDDILMAACDSGPVAPNTTQPVQPAEILEMSDAEVTEVSAEAEIDVSDAQIEVAEELLDLGDVSLGELDEVAARPQATGPLTDSMMELDGLSFDSPSHAGGSEELDWSDLDEGSIDLDLIAQSIDLDDDGNAVLGVEIPDSPLFSSIEGGAFEALLPRLEVRQVAAGATVVREGEPGACFYVIVRGEVEVSRSEPAPHVLTTLSDGDFFGEIAIIADVPRSATVTANQPTELLEISRSALDAVAADHPSITKVLEQFCHRRLLHNLVVSSPLLQALDVAPRQELIDAFRTVSVDDGKDIIREGETLKALFLVLAGEVKVTVGDEERARLSVGDVFGEMGLFFDEPAAATVAAAGNCQLLRLGGPAFTAFCEKHASVRDHLAQLSQARAEANAKAGEVVNPHPSV